MLSSCILLFGSACSSGPDTKCQDEAFDCPKGNITACCSGTECKYTVDNQTFDCKGTACPDTDTDCKKNGIDCTEGVCKKGTVCTEAATAVKNYCQSH